MNQNNAIIFILTKCFGSSNAESALFNYCNIDFLKIFYANGCEMDVKNNYKSNCLLIFSTRKENTSSILLEIIYL
jgi:hypothetical protein